MSQALSIKGHNVHIITSAHNKRSPIDSIGKNVFVHEIDDRDPFWGAWAVDKFLPILDLAYSYKVKRILDEIVQKYSIDIVESPDWLGEGFCYSYAKSAPLVVRLHGDPSLSIHYLQKMSKKTIRNMLGWIHQKALLKNADLISSCSSDYALQVSKILHIELEKISVIYPGIDTSLFCPNQTDIAKEDFVLFVGRLEQRKGIEVLYDAIPMVLERFPSIKFKFIGADTPHPEHNYTWRGYLLNKYNDKRVSFISDVPQEELVGYYKRSLFCVFPSLYEMFGNVALEAMACGKPVVATNVGGFQEFVKDGYNGILIDPNNEKQLASAMIQMISDNQQRQQMASNAYMSVVGNHIIDDSIEKTLNFYEHAIEIFKRGHRGCRK
jgi:glycosyltransferase involved in cell wall biosynthesis